MTKRLGGCLCGGIKYTVDWPPLAVATCHCKNCQKQAGSALSVIVVVARDSLKTSGMLKTFIDMSDSGRPVYRQFCPNCGSPIISDTPQAKEDGIIFLKAGTLDDTSDMTPGMHYWTESAQSWYEFPDHGTRLPRQ